MGFPRSLKNMMLFQNGTDYRGEVPSITLPKLTRKLEEYRAGGMDATVKLDMGQEAMEMEFSTGGPIRDFLASWGGSINGTMVRFTGAYQQDDSSGVDAVDVVVRGRYEEIDMGEQKLGEAGGHKMKLSLSYYRLDWNGETVIEIDVINMTCVVNGVDVLTAQRNALGI